MSVLRRFSLTLFHTVFHDEFRLLEIFSLLNLFAWARLMASEPGFLLRDNYASFSSLPAGVWALIFAGVGLFQLLAVVIRHRRTSDHRFVAMVFASGAWTLVATNFLQSGVSTTAEANYVLLAVLAAISGVMLGWKSSSSSR